MSAIQLLVLDIDGTIAGKSNQVTPRVKAAVREVRDRGVRVVLATGRMYRSTLWFHQDLGLDTPIVAYQGAWIQDPRSDRPVLHFPLPKTILREVFDYLETWERQDRISLHFYLDDRLYVRETNTMTQHYLTRSRIDPVVVADLRSLLDRETTKLLAVSEDIALLDELQASLRQRYPVDRLYLTKSEAIYLEMADPAVNKGMAIRYLAEQQWHLSPENVMAIGNSFNDIEMIDYAGVGVAMADSPLELRSVADWIAPDVNSDGVVEAIEKFILKPAKLPL